MKSIIKKIVLLLAVIVLIVLGVMQLFHNKSSNEAKAKSTESFIALPVTVEEAKLENLSELLSLVGTVYGSRDVIVVSETQGRITALFADIGDYLKAGDAIVQVDDEIKNAALMNAEANYQKTKKDLERYEWLNKEKSVTDAQLEGARLAYKMSESQYIIARRQLKDTKITAPFSGVVTARNAEIGLVVNPGTPIVNLVDISILKIKINVAEKDIFKMKISDKVEITTDVYPKASFEGVIKNISAKADESHTYLVEISLANSRENPLKAGMFTQVSFNSIKSGESIIIPRKALVGSIKKPQVFVVENNIAELRDLVIGTTVNDKLEVLQGLAAGESVVTTGQINLRDKSEVTIVK